MKVPLTREEAADMAKRTVEKLNKEGPGDEVYLAGGGAYLYKFLKEEGVPHLYQEVWDEAVRKYWTSGVPSWLQTGNLQK